MPYGVSTDENKSVTLFAYNHYPGGSTFYDKGSMRILDQRFYRFGTNNPRGTGPEGKPPVTYIRIPVTVYKGPKLPYKTWNPKVGKFTWKRAPITVYKLKKVRNPRVKPAKGLNLQPNPLQFCSSTMKVMPHSAKSLIGHHESAPGWSREYVGNIWSLDDVIGGGSLPHSVDHQAYLSGGTLGLINEASDKALRKLYASVNNSETNLLNTLAERAQTIGMLTDLVKRLGTAIYNAKRGNLYKAAQSLFPWGTKSPSKAIANDFLMFQYGVKPLIDDIDGLIKHLNNWEPFVFDVKASSTVKLDAIRAVYNTTYGINAEFVQTTTGKAQVTWKVRVKTTDNFARNLSRLGLTNLTATAWELIPWSHIIDWLLGVGKYLDTRDAFENLEVVYCTKTIFLKEDVLYDRSFGGRDSNGYVWQKAETQVIVSKALCERSLQSVPALPLPVPKNPFSTQHVANALAHLRQLSRK